MSLAQRCDRELEWLGDSFRHETLEDQNDITAKIPADTQTQAGLVLKEITTCKGHGQRSFKVVPVYFLALKGIAQLSRGG